jgi:hypothetical protein
MYNFPKFGSYLTFNRGHVGSLASSSDTTFKADPLKMIQANVGLNWPGIFIEEDLFYKSLRFKDDRRTTYSKWRQKFIWLFGLGELKT